MDRILQRSTPVTAADNAQLPRCVVRETVSHRAAWLRALAALAAVTCLACAGPERGAGREDERADSEAGDASRWIASAERVGPVRVGMTVAEAERALGARFLPLTDQGECAYRTSMAAPEGVRFMQIADQIARVDIVAPGVGTDGGIEVGATEARVRQVYGPGVSLSPHKYTDGQYLTVPADSGHRIVFETDGERVTRYRVGRLPEVEWVEGCS
jgi:hypothetical protein